MTDPTTTTRDGDVLTELDDCIFALNTAISAARHEARLDAVSSNEAVESLDRLITSHRALQQRLDAAEQRAARVEYVLAGLLDVAERYRGGDTNLDIELWYSWRDAAYAALTESEPTDA